MKRFIKRKIGDLFGFNAELEAKEMALVAISVAAQCNTRMSAGEQRLSDDSPWMCAAVKDVHRAVDREIELRDQANIDKTVINDLLKQVQEGRENLGYQISRNDGLRDALTRKTEEFDALSLTIEEHVDARVRASECHVMVRQDLEAALDRIGDMLKADDGQAFKEAEKFLNRFRSTKNCIKCGSEMIPLRSEDKKLCSNGACGHEVEWPLEEGQEYMHKRNVEPFVEDRSQVQESLDA